MTKKSRIAVFASGSGTNAEEIFKYFQNHSSISVVLLLCNNPQAAVLRRAAKYNIPAKLFTREDFIGSEKVLDWLKEMNVTHVVLAGFLWLLPEYLIRTFPKEIINIHPSLLPKFGGKGMYGSKVHEAVKQSGESETGITIHVVNKHYDEGQVLYQASCKLEPTDTPELIASKVHRLEHKYYSEVIERWVGDSS
jgi:phosphoribosylglycinamide formyltransferase-1